MTPEQAIIEIENMVFRPGWKLHAIHNWLCDPGQVFVWADVKTWDTSYRAPDGTLTVRKDDLDPQALIDVTELDRAGLCHAILIQLVRPFDDHEDREFLACRQPDGSWKAPLHPHTYDGELAWYRRLPERAAIVLSELERVMA